MVDLDKPQNEFDLDAPCHLNEPGNRNMTNWRNDVLLHLWDSDESKHLIVTVNNSRLFELHNQKWK
jgi:hypothetical protein